MMEPENLCPVCGRMADTPFIPCGECGGKMRIPVSDTCRICSAELAGSDDPCPDCRRPDHPSSLDGLSSIGPWMGPLREWLSLLKYGGDVRLVRWLAREFLDIWTSNWQGLPVVPVPPRRGKIAREGRCIVALIASELEKSGIPILRVLRRKDKMPQKSLNRKERLGGDRLSYSVDRGTRITGPLVLLDDVTTTGATLSACAGVLKCAGGGKVFAMVVCRD